MKISYECSKLIEELENDIAEFGDIDMYAFYKKINGNTFIVDYDFVNKEKPLTSQELGTDCIAYIEKASEILKKLKEQNSTI